MKGELLGNKEGKVKEFEEEDRIKWIESKEAILNKFIKEQLDGKKLKLQMETGNTDDDIVIESTEGTERVDNFSKRSANELVLNDILPPKPENSLLSIRKPPKTDDPDTSSLVFSEEIQSQHDNLTNELIATVQLIKRNNLHIQKIVKSDEKVINEATGLLATNSDAMKREGKHLNSYSKKAWVSFWKMILILLFVCLAFIFVYIFIRLT